MDHDSVCNQGAMK